MVKGDQGPVSISEKMSFHKISLSLEAAKFVFRIVRSLWNLTGTSAAVLPMCLSNFKAIQQFKVSISWLRDFTRSYEKTSFRILRQGPGWPWTDAVMETGSIRLSTLRPVANNLLNDALRLDNELSALAATCSLRSVSKVQINHFGLQNPL